MTAMAMNPFGISQVFVCSPTCYDSRILVLIAHGSQNAGAWSLRPQADMRVDEVAHLGRRGRLDRQVGYGKSETRLCRASRIIRPMHTTRPVVEVADER